MTDKVKRSKWLYVKRALLVLALVLVALVIWEARYSHYWLSLSRFIMYGQEPVAQASEQRFDLVEKDGDGGSSDRLLQKTERGDLDFSKLTEYAEENQSDSLLIYHGGKLLVEEYADGLTRNFQPESASMHKSVLGLLFAIADHEGKLKIDDPIGKYIPEWTEDPRGDIPLRAFVTMSSGLEPIPLEQSPFSDYLKFMLGRDSRAIALGQPATAAPYEVFHYQNVVSQIAGYALEKAVGMPYADYLDSRLMKPLGASTYYVWPPGKGETPRVYAALLARPIDWLKIGIMVKDQGRFDGKQIIPANALEKALAPSRANVNYGWFLWLANDFEEQRFYNDAKEGFAVASTEPSLANDLIYFDGFGGQRVYVSREYDFVIVRTGPVQNEWNDTLLPNAMVRALNAKDNELQKSQTQTPNA